MSAITERRQAINRQRELRDRYQARAMRAAKNHKLSLYEYYRGQALIHCETLKWLQAAEEANIPTVRFTPIYKD